jgi:hypothetical protein
MRPARAPAPGGATPTPNGGCAPGALEVRLKDQAEVLDRAARWSSRAAGSPTSPARCCRRKTASRSAPLSRAIRSKILIVDFGSQVTQLIARRVREEGVYCEIVPFQKAEEAFAR